MVRLRPWPGRGVRAEPRSSQLWMLRLRRETRGARRQPQLGSSLSGALAPAPAAPHSHPVGTWLAEPAPGRRGPPHFLSA